MRIQRMPATHGLSQPALAMSLININALTTLTEVSYGEPDHDMPATGTARGWHRCADLLTDPAEFGQWHKVLTEWLHAEFGQAPDRTAAGYIKSWYLSVPALLGALLFHHERRVPSLRPAHISFRIAGTGRPHSDAIALHASEFACLPDDKDADAPEATVVADEQALAALLRARYVAHAAEFVRQYSPPVRFGRHSIWAAATDALDVCLWKAGKVTGNEDSGVADATLVLPERLAPFTAGSTLHSRQEDEGTVWTRRKESCCFNYLLENGSGACGTCPRRSPPIA